MLILLQVILLVLVLVVEEVVTFNWSNCTGTTSSTGRRSSFSWIEAGKYYCCYSRISGIFITIVSISCSRRGLIIGPNKIRLVTVIMVVNVVLVVAIVVVLVPTYKAVSVLVVTVLVVFKLGLIVSWTSSVNDIVVKSDV